MSEPNAHVTPSRNDCKSSQIALCGSGAMMVSGGQQVSWPHSSLYPFPRFLAQRHSPEEEPKGYPHLLNVPNPIPDVVEGLLVGNVVDQHDTLGRKREEHRL